MLRSKLSQGRSGHRSKLPHLEAGVPRTVTTVVVLPTVAVAAGMHFNPEFRSFVDGNVPGASEALSKVTGVDYKKDASPQVPSGATGSTLPESYDTLPELLKRIGDDESKNKKGQDGKNPGGEASRTSPAIDAATVYEKAKAAASNGASEASANAANLAEKAGTAAKSAEAALAALGSSAANSAKAAAGSAKDVASSKESPGNIAAKNSIDVSHPGTADAKDDNRLSGAPSSDSFKTAVDSAAAGDTGKAKEKSSPIDLSKNEVSPPGSSKSEGDGSLLKASGSAAAGGGVSGERSSSSWWNFGFGGAGSTEGAAGDDLAASAKKAGDNLSSEPVPAIGGLGSSAPGSKADGGSLSVSSGGGVQGPGTNGGTESKSASPSSWWKFGSGGETDGGAAKSKMFGASQGADKNASPGSGGGDNFVRLFGKGDFDPSTIDGKDVVDVNVYRRPSYLDSSPSSSMPQTPGAKPHVGKTDLPSLSTGGSAGTEVEALQAELKSQAKWDAVRLQEAVRAQSVTEKKIAAAELAAVTKKHKLELSKAQEKAMAEAQGLIDSKLKEMEAKMEKRRDAEVARLLKEREAELKVSLESEHLQRGRAAAGERERELLEMKASVDALHEDLDQSREHRKASQNASAVAASAFSLRDALEDSAPFASELKAASKTSEIGALVAASIPVAASKDGLPTFKSLKDAFAPVALEGRKAALVPDSEVGSMWAHILASIVSRVKVAVDRGNEPFVPFSDEERIRLAEKRINEGNLEGAVRSLSDLKGLPAGIFADWVALANARIAADVGAQALLADAIVTQQELANMSKPSGNDSGEYVGCHW